MIDIFLGGCALLVISAITLAVTACSIATVIDIIKEIFE